MAAEYLQTERAGEALALLDDAPSPPPGREEQQAWRLARSLGLLQLRRFSEAEAELDAMEENGSVAAEIAPQWLWRRILLADYAKTPRGRRDARG